MAALPIMITASPSVEFDAQLIKRMSQTGPRYTSYPTADRFTDSFTAEDYRHAVERVREKGACAPLSLYLHIPFCNTVCYYCGCNKIVTKDKSKAVTYLAYLKREIDMQAKLFTGMNKVEQLHFGGGTPTYLSDEQMDDLLAHLRSRFEFAADEVGEYSIEVDPRTVDPDRVRTLRRQGFNRISLGVQDFDPVVQKAVNRIQPEEQTLAVIKAARDAGFRSISIDLIYGLPKQNLISMSQTIDKVIAAAPDRLAIYNYAHLPHLFKPQRRIAEEDLPSADTKLDMLALCIKRLNEAGYVYIGMDHFAKPTDDLAIAQKEGRLHRNFQGYSTHADADLVSCGVSAISSVGNTFSQNVKTLDEYYAKLDADELPISRGMKLGMDDFLRRSIIQMLMCHFELSVDAVEEQFPISFASYFADELNKLKQFETDGLLSVSEGGIKVHLKGRLLIRNICMVFDRYLNLPRVLEAHPVRFSKTI